MENHQILRRSRLSMPDDWTPRGIKDRDALLTPKEAARWLRVSEDTVRRYLRQGRIEYLKVGIQIRIEVAALQRYIDQCRDNPDQARLKAIERQRLYQLEKQAKDQERRLKLMERIEQRPA